MVHPRNHTTFRIGATADIELCVAALLLEHDSVYNPSFRELDGKRLERNRWGRRALNGLEETGGEDDGG
jgi:hypothetical protein